MGKWKSTYEERRKYNKEWEIQFKWLTCRDSLCHCKVCNLDIKSMKRDVLLQHEKSVKHVNCISQLPKPGKSIQSFFGNLNHKKLLQEFEIKYRDN